MLKLKVTEDKRHFEVVDYDDTSMQMLRDHFTRENANHFHNPAFQKGVWDGFDRFVKEHKYISTGLWDEINLCCEELDIPFEYVNFSELTDMKAVNKGQFLRFCDKLFEGTEITNVRHYQPLAVMEMLKYKYALVDMVMASGKTILLYILTAYLKLMGEIDKDNKLMIVVPKAGLVGQTYEKFSNNYCNGKIKLNYCLMGGKFKFKKKDYDAADVIITTYQSLRTKNNDFFKKVAAVMVDEAHEAKESIKTIMQKAAPLKYRMGMSGTIDEYEDKYSAKFLIQENFGPIVYKYVARDLIDDGYAPEVRIRFVHLDYSDVYTDEIRKYKDLLKNGKDMYASPTDFGKAMYKIETSLIREHEARLDFLAQLVVGLGKNTLILFTDVLNEYGKRIVENIKKRTPHVYYIDGSVKVGTRAEYQDIMEQGKGVVLVASYGTFSTGIDLKNVHYILNSESFKSPYLTKQTFGRGMRNFEDKHEIIVIDIVDTFGKYSKAHARERNYKYIAEGFVTEKYKHRLKKITTA